MKRRILSLLLLLTLFCTSCETTYTVEEYQTAIEAEYQNGYDKGYDDGYEKGKAKGREGGYTQGYLDGHDEGYDEGYKYGFTKGEASVKTTTTTKKTTSTSATSNQTYTVYITKTGDKYHRYGCQYLHSSCIAKDINAVKYTHTPCSKCKP